MAVWRVVCCVAACCASLVVATQWWRRRRQSGGVAEPPTQWQRVGEVTQLLLFPLKSGRARFVEQALCGQLGLVDVQNPALHLHDREFIVYDDIKKSAISGLVKPPMTLMEVSPLDDKTLKFSFPGEENLYLKLPVDSSQLVILNRWWGETVGAVDCGEEAAQWLTRCLRDSTRRPRLGHFARPTVPLRNIRKGWTHFARVYHRLRSDYLGAYSYMASYLLVTEESMDEVNSRLLKPRDARHYRANIVVRCDSSSGSEQPFTEDAWDWLRIGDTAVLRGFKPCTRCAVTAIDVDTGKLDPNLEPLHTLKQFRQLTREEERELSGSEPMFGLYAGLHTPGAVRLGDPVYVAHS